MVERRIHYRLSTIYYPLDVQAAADPFPLPRDPAARAASVVGITAACLSVSSGAHGDDARADDASASGRNVSRVYGCEFSAQRARDLPADLQGMPRMSVATGVG